MIIALNVLNMNWMGKTMETAKQKNDIKTFNVYIKDNEVSEKISRGIIYNLTKKGLGVSEKPDIVICIGGDGTFLRAIDHYKDRLDEVLFCGVHTGTLGFLTDFKVDQIPQLLDSISGREYFVEKAQMLRTKIFHDDGVAEYLSLNEGRIENNLTTLVLDVYVDNNHFETFRGNGLNFCTSTGSTGYNKSLGGAIVHPRVEGFQMCEIASINNREYRPLGSSFVFNTRHTVTLLIRDGEGLIFGYDTKAVELEKTFKGVRKIQFGIAEETVRFIRFVHKPFSQRVKRNFIK